MSINTDLFQLFAITPLTKSKEYELKMLLDFGADVNYYDKQEKSTVLWQAIVYGTIQDVKMLIKNGVDVDFFNDESKTALERLFDKDSFHLRFKRNLICNFNLVTCLLLAKTNNNIAIENIYKYLTIDIKEVLFKHLIKNKSLLQKLNILKMKNFTKDINEYITKSK